MRNFSLALDAPGGGTPHLGRNISLQVLMIAIAVTAAVSSAYAQEPVAEACAEYLAPSEWPKRMSPLERAVLDAMYAANAPIISVEEMVAMLPNNVASVNPAVPAVRAIEDPTNYRTIRDWKNPLLLIRPQEFEIRSDSLIDGSLRAPITALRCIVSNLPESAWPHGQVVQAVAGGTIGSLADMYPIRLNRDAAELTLQELQIEIWWLPP